MRLNMWIVGGESVESELANLLTNVETRPISSIQAGEGGANGKLQGSWYGNNAVFYDPILTSENYKSFTNPYLIYDVIFSTKNKT